MAAVITSNVEIIGTIGEDVVAYNVRKQLDAAGDDVCLYIDSPGGDVIESNAISLAIAEYVLLNPRKTYTCTLGSLVASAAANILAKLPEAFTIRAYKDSLIMYHSCSALIEGTPQQLHDFAVMMALVNEGVIRQLSNKTSLPMDELKATFSGSGELWLDAYKAFDCGLIDGIIGEESTELKYTENRETKTVLALVAKYRASHKKETKAMAKAECENEDLKQETDLTVEEIPLTDEGEKVEEAIEEAVEKELTEEPVVDEEIDVDALKAECEELKAENNELKTEIEGLKALIAKYRPAAKASAKTEPKRDWLTMVKALNAKNLNDRDYAKEYAKLKAENKMAFDAFMKNHSVR